jgi:hypothetical protein
VLDGAVPVARARRGVAATERATAGAGGDQHGDEDDGRQRCV